MAELERRVDVLENRTDAIENKQDRVDRVLFQGSKDYPDAPSLVNQVYHIAKDQLDFERRMTREQHALAESVKLGFTRMWWAFSVLLMLVLINLIVSLVL